MVLVKAKVRLLGVKDSYSSIALADTGARMSLVDRALAEHIGVEHTGREISFVSISGHAVKALEAIVSELEVEGEALKYEAIAVAEIPKNVKETLKNNELDENMIIGVLTLERANMIPDTTTGTLKKVESFILSFTPQLFPRWSVAREPRSGSISQSVLSLLRKKPLASSPTS